MTASGPLPRACDATPLPCGPGMCLVLPKVPPAWARDHHDDASASSISSGVRRRRGDRDTGSLRLGVRRGQRVSGTVTPNFKLNMPVRQLEYQAAHSGWQQFILFYMLYSGRK